MEYFFVCLRNIDIYRFDSMRVFIGEMR